MAAYLAQKMHLHVRQASLAAARCGPRWLTALVRYPLYFISHLLSTSLHTGVRLALEVSIEYSLGLSFALDGRALRGHKGAKGSRDDEVREALRAELTQQKGVVWNFILDRCAGAKPRRFSSSNSRLQPSLSSPVTESMCAACSVSGAWQCHFRFVHMRGNWCARAPPFAFYRPCDAPPCTTCRVREAPDRFRAVQTYRAAMAVMAYQRAFVHKLCSTGIVDESELKVFEEVRYSAWCGTVQPLLPRCASAACHHSRRGRSSAYRHRYMAAQTGSALLLSVVLAACCPDSVQFALPSLKILQYMADLVCPRLRPVEGHHLEMHHRA